MMDYGQSGFCCLPNNKSVFWLFTYFVAEQGAFVLQSVSECLGRGHSGRQHPFVSTAPSPHRNPYSQARLLRHPCYAKKTLLGSVQIEEGSGPAGSFEVPKWAFGFRTEVPDLRKDKGSCVSVNKMISASVRLNARNREGGAGYGWLLTCRIRQ